MNILTDTTELKTAEKRNYANAVLCISQVLKSYERILVSVGSLLPSSTVFYDTGFVFCFFIYGFISNFCLVLGFSLFSFYLFLLYVINANSKIQIHSEALAVHKLFSW